MDEIANNLLRFVAEYSNESEFLRARHMLARFDIAAFQRVFGVSEAADPMYDCYEVTQENVRFLSDFLAAPVDWDFSMSSYYVEAEAV